jgi:hypothetical protein
MKRADWVILILLIFPVVLAIGAHVVARFL